MTPQVIERNTDPFKHLSAEEKRTISSANDLIVSYFDLKDNKGGFRVIEMKDVRTPTDFDQAYFWSDEWQKDERAIDEEFKSGKFKRFSSPNDAIAYLRE